MIVAATGHRPNKLGGYQAPDAYERGVKLAAAYLRWLRPEKGISGMALGWDQIFAEACIREGVPFIAALPFAGQDAIWPKKARTIWQRLCDKADEVVIVCKGPYAPAKMLRRNGWMVDHSDRLAALYDGSPGGTHNCIAYARSKQRQIDNLWPIWRGRLSFESWTAQQANL